MGAFDYIPKPFTPDELRALVSRAIKPAEAEASQVAQESEAKIPFGYYYLLGHTWLKLENDERGIVGVMPDFLKSIGIIANLELPKIGDFISQGEVCAKITDSDRFVHHVWSPVAGRVIEINIDLLQDLSPLSRFPFTRGYLFKMEASRLQEDLEGLLVAK